MNEELITKMKAYVKASRELLAVYNDGSDEVKDQFNKHYTFTKSFEEVHMDTVMWVSLSEYGF